MSPVTIIICSDQHSFQYFTQLICGKVYTIITRLRLTGYPQNNSPSDFALTVQCRNNQFITFNTFKTKLESFHHHFSHFSEFSPVTMISFPIDEIPYFERLLGLKYHPVLKWNSIYYQRCLRNGRLILSILEVPAISCFFGWRYTIITSKPGQSSKSCTRSCCG